MRESREMKGRRLNLIHQMCDALKYVHEQEYIHRDICPRNFICAEDLASLKLIDFGLTVPATKDFMQPGNRTGTPNYMAPEVIRRRHTDKRLDIFALGVTLFQMCTYQLPWPGQDASGKAAVVHDTRPPTDIYSLYPELDRAVGDTIMRCLEVRPENRPQSMDEVIRGFYGADETRI